MDNFFIEHIKDLSEKSVSQNVFTFSAFLSPEEQSEVTRRKKELTFFEFFGGADGTQRNIVRFGSPEDLGYSADWDIVCLKFTPRGQKFADTLTHRDVLGAIMNTGIERDRLGDIVISGNSAYVFTGERTAQFLSENVDRIKHTAVDAEVCESIPSGELFKTRTERRTAASLRLDCVIGAAFNFSRSKSDQLLSAKNVFVNYSVCENSSYTVKPGDVISVRGYGKFIFSGTAGTTKKGRAVFDVDLYV